MASSGDPSTFTFTMDAFPDYTRWNRNKKVLSAIQIITDEDGEENKERSSTADSLTAAAESVRINAPDNAQAGKTVAVQAEVEPKGSAVVTWSVEPDSAGKFVPAKGNKVNFVIGEKASGTATITATAEDITDTHTIAIAAKA
jgi:hypothetical protein